MPANYAPKDLWCSLDRPHSLQEIILMTAATNYLCMLFILLPSIWKAEIWMKWKKPVVSVYSCYTKQDWHTTSNPWYYNSGKCVVKWCSVTAYSSTGFTSSIISLLYTSTHTSFLKCCPFISSYDTAFLLGNGKNTSYLSIKHHMPLTSWIKTTNLTLIKQSLKKPTMW